MLGAVTTSSDQRASGAAAAGADGLAIWFDAAGRPTAADIARYAASAATDVPFRITHRPAQGVVRLELVAGGLAFDLHGLAPGPTEPVSAPRHRYDLAETDQPLAAVTIAPGPHLRSVLAVLPVTRALIAVGCSLITLPGVMGVSWQPAATIMSPTYFSRVMRGWLDGGAFPGLGLTALEQTPDAMRSEGLAHFLGYELAVATAADFGPAQAAKLALRAMHALVAEDVAPAALPARLGEPARRCTFTADGRLLWIGRD